MVLYRTHPVLKMGRMLSKEENDFIRFWEANRLRRKKTVRQFLLGIPAGLLIVIPIVVNLLSGWYKRANMEANSPDFNPAVLLVALLLIVGFTAIFWQRHQWDQYEQRYRELLARRDRGQGAVAAGAAENRDQSAAGTAEPAKAGNQSAAGAVDRPQGSETGGLGAGGEASTAGDSGVNRDGNSD
jgi:hypothetical protein